MINRKKLETYIPIAIEILNDWRIGIVDQDTKTCNDQYRSVISNFGASLTNGSLHAAVCYLTEDKSQSSKRPALLLALYYVANKANWDEVKNNRSIYTTSLASEANRLAREIICENSNGKNQKYMLAAVALKQALNLFIVKDSNTSNGKEGQNEEQSAPAVS